MSVAIKNNMIIMTRGDTLQAQIAITDSDGNTYTPVEGDVIRFAMKETYDDIKPLLVKEIPYDTLILRIESEETKSLKQPGTYVYDIQITMTDGTVDTFTTGKVKITEEID